MEANSSLPTYRIFRDKHGIPQFEPKRGTQALKDALIYAFPTLETELDLMQAALRKFFSAERGSKFVFELAQNDLQNSLMKPRDVEICPIIFGKAALRSSKLPDRRGRRRGSRASSRASSRPPSRPPSRALSRVSSRAPETPGSRPATPTDVNLGGKMTTWVLSSGQELEGRKKQPYDPVKRRKVAENRGNVCEKHRVSKTMCDPELCPDNKAYVAKDSIDLNGGFSSLPTVEEIRKTDIDNVQSSFDIMPGTSTGNLSGLSDRFWDASETPDLSFDDSQTLWSEISLTDSHSTPWTDYSSTVGLPAEKHTADQVPFQENESGDITMSGYQEQHLPMMNEPHQGFNQPPLHVPNSLQQQDLSNLRTSAPCSEDPFMGWTTKRSSQICDDYGFILSHVGSL